MTLVKFNNGHKANAVNPWFGDVFDAIVNDSFLSDRLVTKVPAVNIAETENGFHVELAAPGLQKEDFKINLDKNVLSVSVEKKSETTDGATARMPAPFAPTHLDSRRSPRRRRARTAARTSANPATPRGTADTTSPTNSSRRSCRDTAAATSARPDPSADRTPAPLAPRDPPARRLLQSRNERAAAAR